MGIVAELVSRYKSHQESKLAATFAIQFTQAAPEEIPSLFINSVRFGIEEGPAQAAIVHQQTFENPTLPPRENVIFIPDNSSQESNSIPIFKPYLE